MAGTVLRLLQHRLRAKGFNHRRDLFRLMPHDDNRLFRAQWRTRPDDMFNERPSARAV